MNTDVIYNPYYRSNSQKSKASSQSRLYAWVTNGTNDLRILKRDLDEFLNANIEYKNGRTNA